MIGTLLTLLGAGLAGAVEPRGRAHELRGRLGLRPTEHEGHPVYRRWLWLQRHYPLGALFYGKIMLRGRVPQGPDQTIHNQEHAAAGKVMDWLVKTMDKLAREGRLPTPSLPIGIEWWVHDIISDDVSSIEFIEGESAEELIAGARERAECQVHPWTDDCRHDYGGDSADVWLAIEHPVLRPDMRTIEKSSMWIEGDAVVSDPIGFGEHQIRIVLDDVMAKVTFADWRTFAKARLEIVGSRWPRSLEQWAELGIHEPLSMYMLEVIHSIRDDPESVIVSISDWLDDRDSPPVTTWSHAEIGLVRAIITLRQVNWHAQMCISMMRIAFSTLLDQVLAGEIVLADSSMDAVYRRMNDLNMRDLTVGLQREIDAAFADVPSPEMARSGEEPIAQFSDGAIIVRLWTEAALVHETDRMHHCVGRRRHGHPQAVAEGREVVYSYRDPSGKPRWTFAVNPRHPSYATVDIQGPHNGPITDDDARDRLAWFGVQLRARGVHVPPSDRHRLQLQGDRPEEGQIIEMLVRAHDDVESRRYQVASSGALRESPARREQQLSMADVEARSGEGEE